MVSFGRINSASALHLCGVPQGSILELFSLYLLPLGSILKRYGISFHFYADESQIYLFLKGNDGSSLKFY